MPLQPNPLGKLYCPRCGLLGVAGRIAGGWAMTYLLQRQIMDQQNRPVWTDDKCFQNENEKEAFAALEFAVHTMPRVKMRLVRTVPAETPQSIPSEREEIVALRKALDALGYTRIFNAISHAISWREHKQIDVSVERFKFALTGLEGVGSYLTDEQRAKIAPRRFEHLTRQALEQGSAE